ncbi:MAG: T9SS type A sorting domain-containing protein [Bacteroidota bacterium]
MKHFNPYLLFFLFLITGATQAQVINNQIHYAVRTGDLYADNDWNIFGSDRIAMLIDVYDYTNFNDWLGAECVPFTVNGDGIIESDHRLVASVSFADYNTQLTFDLDAWGESTTPNQCNFDAADFLRKYLVADEDGLQNTFTIWNAGNAASWSDDWSSQVNNWLYGDANYDAKMETIWRYVAGNTQQSPLDFGTLSNGQLGKQDRNSNRQQPSDFDPDQLLFGYSNTGYRPSPDVYYTFTLDSRAKVRISTNSTFTNFDTHLSLIGPSGVIVDNDDVAPGNLNSQITETLCAGTYTVVVEGLNQFDVGDFLLSVDIIENNPLFTVGESITPASCPDGQDGSVTLNPMNGGLGTSYSVSWSDGTSGPFLERTDMAPGIYEVTVTNCGATVSKIITVPNDDTEIPSVSVDNISVEAPEGSTFVVDAELMGINSTDNCGIVSYTASPTTLQAISGTYIVNITVADAAGNSNSDVGLVDITTIPAQAGESCGSAESVDNLFGGPENQPQTSSILNNIGYSSEGDPEFGAECLGDGIQASRWFSFTGDGNSYEIRVPFCSAANPIPFDDSQIALYAGSCGDLTPVACNDDLNPPNRIAAITFNTVAGQIYSFFVDGYTQADEAEGEFCLEVTRLGASSVADLSELGVSLFPNPASEQVTLSFASSRTYEQAQLTIYDLTGRPVWQGKPEGEQKTIATNQLPAGTYIVELRDTSNLGRRHLIIK